MTKQPQMKLSAIVLAGGESRRFGRDKVVELLGSKRLIDHAIERIMNLVDEIIVVVNPGKKLSLTSSVKIVSDIYPDQGPIGGLYTGLFFSNSSYNLVVAADLPFLNLDLLRYLISLAPGYQAVVPRTDGLEPLLAVYSRSCLPFIREMIENGQRQIIRLFQKIDVRYVEPDEIRRIDPLCLSFFNINTANDLERARAIFHSLGELQGG